MNYYNDNDPYCCEWLENLIKSGNIPCGVVDSRDIRDVRAQELTQYTQCHFFAGIGGWTLALQLAGWPADVPVWTGSCPCQPFSIAGKRLGEQDERHLWPKFFRLISECRPPIVFGEQVVSKLGKDWFFGVRDDLEALGYATGAAIIGADTVGAAHRRRRIYFVANSISDGLKRIVCNREEKEQEIQTWTTLERNHREYATLDLLGHGRRHGGNVCPMHDSWQIRSRLPVSVHRNMGYRAVYATIATISYESGVQPLAARIPRKLGSQFAGVRGMARIARRNRTGRLRAYGNAIVPQVAAAFIRSYLDFINDIHI